jgi:N-acetylneuraminic acid mutarotase
MRAVCMLALLAACGFPQPTDRCDGPCRLLRLDRPIANAGDVLWFEGTFEDAGVVYFPGAAQTWSFDRRFDRRAAVTVPPDATTGELTITTSHGEPSKLPFRRAAFKLGLQQWSPAHVQNDSARTSYLERVPAGATAVTIGSRVFLIGGVVSGGATANVEVAHAGLDGGVGRFAPSTRQLLERRAYHSTTVIGNYVYVIGGASDNPLTSVERTSVSPEGEHGMFEMLPGVALTEPRLGHSSIVIGSYLYVFGGRNGSGELASIERAPINENHGLGPFEHVSGKSLLAPRSHFAIAMLGEALFVIGGRNASGALSDVERFELFGTGDIAVPTPAGQLITPRSNHAAIVLGNKVYVIGGVGGSGTLSTLEVAEIFEQTTLSFTVGQYALSEPKQGAALAVVGNYVYLFGGEWQTGMPALHIDRASLIQSGALAAFTTAPIALNEARGEHASIVIGNKLYVIGGQGDNAKALDSIEVAAVKPDGTLEAFSVVARLKTARYGHGVVLNDNILYVLGGRDDNDVVLDTIEFATINPNGTLDMPMTLSAVPMLDPRSHFTIFGGGANAYVLGGAVAIGSPMPSSTIELLTFTNGKQLELPTAYNTDNIKEARERAATAVIGSHVYVFGGRDGGMFRQIARAGVPLLDANFSTVWGVLPDRLLRPKQGLTTTVVGESIYFIGGDDQVGSAGVERATITPAGFKDFVDVSAAVTMVNPRTAHTTVTLGDYVYLIGGQSQAGPKLVSLEVQSIK